MRLHRKINGRIGSLAVMAVLLPGLIWAEGDFAEPVPQEKTWEKTDTMISQALVGTLYYEFEEWLPRFRERIAQLEKKPKTVANRVELMKYHFYLAGLLAELSHVLSFTSKFKVESIRNDFDHNSRRSKELAEEILEMPGITRDQKAEVYFFLGASEGYVGIVEYGAGHLLTALINGLRADKRGREEG